MDFCTIASGSSGNCTYVGTDRTAVLVDVGISGKKICEGLAGIDRLAQDISGVLLTHEHIDHIKGLGVFSRKYHLPIYATRGTIDYLITCGRIGEVDASLYRVIRADETFSIGDMEVEPFRIQHDAAEPVGFRISGNGRTVAVATDTGCYDDEIVSHLKDVDAMLLEANHDQNMLEVGPYPWPLKQRIMGEKGHLSNETAGRLLCDVLHDHLQTVLLGHLSKENNYEALAKATVCTEVTMGDNPYRGDDFRIEVAHRDRPSELYHIA